MIKRLIVTLASVLVFCSLITLGQEYDEQLEDDYYLAKPKTQMLRYLRASTPLRWGKRSSGPLLSALRWGKRQAPYLVPRSINNMPEFDMNKTYYYPFYPPMVRSVGKKSVYVHGLGKRSTIK